ncbi:hypothetical protein HDU93_005429 [Gonapodya sp. JEL0774]|nr:hypothetical protein HDU93_005429 [Gonapodya sp. JEL0774]
MQRPEVRGQALLRRPSHTAVPPSHPPSLLQLLYGSTSTMDTMGGALVPLTVTSSVITPSPNESSNIAMSAHILPPLQVPYAANSRWDGARRSAESRPQNPRADAPGPQSYPSPPSPSVPIPVDPASLLEPYGGNWNTWLFTNAQLDAMNPQRNVEGGKTEDDLRWKAASFIRRVGEGLKFTSTTVDFATLLFQRYYARTPFRELQPPPKPPPPVPPPPPEPVAPRPPPAVPKRDYPFLRKPAKSSPLNPASHAPPPPPVAPAPPPPPPPVHDPRTPQTYLDTAATCLRIASKLCDRSFRRANYLVNAVAQAAGKHRRVLAPGDAEFDSWLRTMDRTETPVLAALGFDLAERHPWREVGASVARDVGLSDRIARAARKTVADAMGSRTCLVYTFENLACAAIYFAGELAGHRVAEQGGSMVPKEWWVRYGVTTPEMKGEFWCYEEGGGAAELHGKGFFLIPDHSSLHQRVSPTLSPSTVED